MTDDRSEKIASLEEYARRIINNSGGGPPNGMNPRLDHLEARVDRVEGKLDSIIERLGVIATKADMRTYLLTGLGLFLAIVAILVADMGWLETRVTRIEPAPSPPPSPMIFQISPAPAAPVATKKAVPAN
jgi:hypothetical protein